MKKLIALVIGVLILFGAVAYAASPKQLITTHERMLEIERALIEFEPGGYGYAVSHRYSGYSVDEDGTPTYYYPKNISLSTVKKTLRDLDFSTSGIEFVPVEYSWFNLRGAIVPMERAIEQRASMLGFSPAIEFIPEENKIAAYGVPEDEASRKAFLSIFGWDSGNQVLMYKDITELISRSNRAIAMLPKAVINSEKFRAFYQPNVPGRPVILLTDPEDKELREMIPMFFDVRRPENAHAEFSNSVYDAPGTEADKLELRRCYFSAQKLFYTQAAFGPEVDLPISTVSFDATINKVNVGVPLLTEELRQQYIAAIGNSVYLNLEELTIIAQSG